MRTVNVLLGALAGEAFAVVNKWNPEGFDWDSQKTRNNNIEVPLTKQLSIQDGNQTAAGNSTGETDIVFHSRALLDTALGLTLREITWNGAARSATGTAGTAVGCGFAIRDAVQDSSELSDSDVASCVLGVAAGIWGWEPAVKAYLANRDILSNQDAEGPVEALELPQLELGDIGGDFLADIDLSIFSRKKRGLMRRGLHERGFSDDSDHREQLLHNRHMSKAIRDSGVGDGEFLGYAHEEHQLSKRDGTHPLAARFKVDHPRYGPMALSTRHTNTTFHMTAEPHISRDDTNVGRRWEEELRKEFLYERYTEGRFDVDAILSAPEDIEVDKDAAFDDALDGMHCLLGGDDWDFGNQVFDIQGYDNTNRGTFAYASIGVFEEETEDPDGELSGMKPQPPWTPPVARTPTDYRTPSLMPIVS